MSIKVGEVIAIHGVKIILKIYDESSKDTIFYDGDRFKGISIREYLLIQRGFKDIICIVEGEYLDESRYEKDNNKIVYIRKVEAKPIGYFQDGEFYQGIKILPMIKDYAFLVSEEQIACIYGNNDHNGEFTIGTMLKEGLLVSLPWTKLFNTHIGIFGNTGSGKSNTLAMLYTTLFNLKKTEISTKSQFVVIDFNGEYTNDQLMNKSDKKIYDLSTRDAGVNKLPIRNSELWNTEVLSILFKATSNTQIPFLNRVVKGWEKYNLNSDSLTRYIKSTFRALFISTSQKREALELLKNIMEILTNQTIKAKLLSVTWHGQNCCFMANGLYFSNGVPAYESYFGTDIETIDATDTNYFDELSIRINLQLIRDLIAGYVQFEHIQPLLKRVEASSSVLNKVIEVTLASDITNSLLTIVSLRKCNQEVKKIIPLLLAKHIYEQHKAVVLTPPNKTIHLIIDEAHNVLSQQSVREQESWKDYRLELFEEIIKEGRKFGVFLTLSSQRPADISPTIMSQLHNFFIHRLVNDKDLLLLDNTISTLDGLSKSMIPNLAKGCCIVTGTSFDLPLIMQVNRLEKSSQPDSEDVDLAELWGDA